MALTVELIPAFDDNYIFHLTCNKTGKVAVVDPGDAQAVINYIGEHGKLDYILNTHHHMDHVGGNERLQEHYGCVVVGSQYDADKGRIPGLEMAVEEDDHIDIGESIATVMEVPGHTLGHIVYWFDEEDILFCGDTLFAGGCGRLFEGTPEQMYNSLWKLKSLPPQTKIYCAHEYTEANYDFLSDFAPDDAAVAARAKDVKEQRSKGLRTVPTTITTELGSNLFLTAETAVDFARIRKAKDNF